MFYEFTDVEKFIEEQKIRLVDLKYCDLCGRWRHVTLSADRFKVGIMTSGIGIDGSSVELKSVESGDLVIIPDLSTGFKEDFWEDPTLSFICNIADAETKEFIPGDPRQIAKKGQQHLKSTGFADESLWGPEFEFHILDRISIENCCNTASYSLDSIETRWGANQGFTSPPLGSYHLTPPADGNFELRNKMLLKLEDIGIPVKYHHHEVGSPSQCEIETPMMSLLETADAIMVSKYVIRIVASLAGKFVTFLPKPFVDEAGNGLHFHQQLTKAGINAFYEVNHPDRLSQTALFYIGGMLSHAPALLALTNPSTNSYKRLVPGYEAPVNSFYSIGNRSAAIRVPRYATQPDQVRIEFRPPDATCNPYLAVTAMLMAGLDGIQREIDPTVEGYGPINEDIFSWSPEKRAQIKSLPRSLDEALIALEKDHEFLLSGNVFSLDLIENWIRIKKQEINEINIRPHPFEIEKYFDF